MAGILIPCRSLYPGENMVQPFPNNNEYMLAELRYLDRLICGEIEQVRQSADEASDKAFTGVCVSEKEVDYLLSAPPPTDDTVAMRRELTSALRREIDERILPSLDENVVLTLPYLVNIFGLTPFEGQVVLIALAPEIDPKYERLFTYLQDDFSRRRPSVGLVLRLLCATAKERLEARVAFSEQATLFRTGILRQLGKSDGPLPGRPLVLHDHVVSFLLNVNSVNHDFAACVHLHPPARDIASLRWEPGFMDGLLRLVSSCIRGDFTAQRRVILHFYGSRGTGRKTLAAALCHAVDVSLLVADLGGLIARFENFEDALRSVFRQALLNQAAVYLDCFDRLTDDEQSSARRSSLKRAIDEMSWLTFLGSEAPWSQSDLFHPHVYISTELSMPDFAGREALWKSLAAGSEDFAPDIDWDDLAIKFRLTPGAMECAIEVARNHARLRGLEAQVTRDDLYFGCHSQSNQNLAKLARKLAPHYTWSDIVLPKNSLAQLRELCQQVRHRRTVYTTWGFDRKLSLGKGLCVLLYGQSGVGKTMAVEIIANELRLEVYKIDLSTVVSKYIGETEKNLSRIFQEAETSNAVLFFDEADALFGKRTEVKDAHDRYANIEINYLLQRMEEFDGLVILATNLRKNIDEGFFRRMHFAIEFPFPDTAQRYRIWKQHLPDTAPLAGDIDVDHLAERFPFAGGNIRNVVVNAAFLAAANSGEIHMEQLICATRREYEKIGRLCTDTEFAPYQDLLRET
jgi:SpoVK/Ycf46/Vps4 family AAA+-type ATPase